MSEKEYVLVTPARNEEANIGRLIQSVVSQTIRPKKWVVVSDGSVDRTDEIVSGYAKEHDFLQLHRAAEHAGQDFGSKAKAFRAGYDQLKGVEFGFVGNLDADVSFGPDYFERLLEKFEANPGLGLAGGLIHERVGEKFEAQHLSPGSVAGAVQLFRRECFEAIGGYIPMRGGGIDAAAEIMSRMHGWTVQTFTELPVQHHRRVFTGKGNMFSSRFQQGVTNYLLGYHPQFHLLSCLSRVWGRPYFLGSAMGILGYAWAWLRGDKRLVPNEVVSFLRAEQKARMTVLFAGRKTVKQS